MEEISEVKINRANKILKKLIIIGLIYITFITVKYWLFFPAEYQSIEGLLARTLPTAIFLLAMYFGGKFFAQYYYSPESKKK